MDQWIEIISKFGIPIAALVGVAYFLLKQVWPFVVAQIEEAQKQRKAEIDKFIETVRARDVLLVESQREHISALREITKEITALRDIVRGNHR
jgi:hypothetical protein